MEELNNQYDWHKDLSNFADFDGNGDRFSHERALDWYTGTANLIEVPEERYRRLGDLVVNNIAGDAGKNWYTPDHTLATLDHGDKKAAWEGIGTGWFSSVLGGGYEYRPYSTDNALRSSVYLDNTALAKLRRDYTVPTLFNGNFDAIAAQLNQDIPGWNFQDSKDINSQNHLVSNIAGNKSYALRLDNQLSSITHNPFVVPDWGVLRFDLHTPETSLSEGQALYVSLTSIEDSSQNYVEAIELQKAENKITKVPTGEYDENGKPNISIYLEAMKMISSKLIMVDTVGKVFI